jgi:Ca2+-binding RTX toxin-like protein
MHGTDGGNILRGGMGDDKLYGYYGNDTLYGEAGDDLLNGGQGQDTAAYKNPYSNYSIVHHNDGSVIVTDHVRTDGVDTLIGIEFLSFSDQVIDVSILFS